MLIFFKPIYAKLPEMPQKTYVYILDFILMYCTYIYCLLVNPINLFKAVYIYNIQESKSNSWCGP
jgi:hypothetical protein